MWESSRSVERVRICPIFSHERFGSGVSVSSKVRGKPALGVWLVMAAAMTVPDLSLNTS